MTFIDYGLSARYSTDMYIALSHLVLITAEEAAGQRWPGPGWPSGMGRQVTRPGHLWEGEPTAPVHGLRVWAGPGGIRNTCCCGQSDRVGGGAVLGDRKYWGPDLGQVT